ncbi:hypothetical protein DAEQUDRAFT_561427 [Daedalea quercina L-15889]|uniref:ATP-dependent DNA helicase n=1 Tax=Daedalea quercina L-15889 TaxID=1314783 RepID=A0A165LYM4_9APHY|nr:hypothetical protein DAEQUDRAFT_561427 [Daedalea quercina L-15889]
MATGRQPISGLRAVKRDFSSNTIPPTSQDSQLGDSDPSAIPWTSTPPRTNLTGMSQRLKHIQDALKDHIDSSEHALATSQKRSSLSDHDTLSNPPSKRRQLPKSWDEPQTDSARAQPRKFGSTRPANTNAIRVPAATAATANDKPGNVVLSAEQTHILNLAKEGKSLFYTGSAGTGKSVLLREIIAALRQKYRRTADAIAITASTGIAACNIGGVTIHSFAGIGLGIENADALFTKIKKNKKASSRWLRTEVLIIDEVSMVEGELFDKLCRIGSMMRRKSAPFGGIQVC